MKKKIKVLHVIGALNLGGAETMAVNLMRNIDRENIQFDFYLSGNSGGFYEKDVLALGGNIINVGHRKKHPLKYCTELIRIIRKERYDVVQIHATNALDGLPAMLSFFAGAKKRCLFSHCSGGQSLWKQKIMRRMFMPFVTNLQACSDVAAQWMYGNQSKKADIIPLPINCEGCTYSAKRSDEKKAQWGIEQCKVIGHIGRFAYPKNHIRIIEIFAELAKRDDTYRLVLIGDGTLQQEIRCKVKENSIEDKVVFMGQIENAYQELSMFDVLLFPSLYEGFPTVLLEAQANGLPCVVASTVTPTIALTDLIHFIDLKQSNTDWADEIEKMIGIRNEAEEYQKIIAKTYDLKAVAKHFSEIYSE